jgi:hypothetical protein
VQERLVNKTSNNKLVAAQLEEQLLMIIGLLQAIPVESYISSIDALGNASIGQHTRHIIELLQALEKGYASRLINYADRKRDVLLENDPSLAQATIQKLMPMLEWEDTSLKIVIDEEATEEALVHSSFYRELLHNTEHATHHMALIKVALRVLKLPITTENFGLAYATIKHKEKQCAP